MSDTVDRALLLIHQGRNDLAVPELQKHLGTEPHDSFAHALMAMCLSDEEKFADATRHAQEAIQQDPDNSFAHYVNAYVLRDRNRFDEALPAVQEAIRLDPYSSGAYGLLAQIHLAEKRNEEALAAAERGLEADPEDVTCQNLRGMALKNLGRFSEATQAIDGALAREPENSLTHSNKGWALLEKNQHKEALHHFQEALRLDPSNEWAREGVVCALKSRYRLYAWMLKYKFWMQKRSNQTQWGVVLGLYFGMRFLRVTATAHPEWAGVLGPLRTILIGFVIFTWIADPLFNLALRMNKYGRLALSRDQVNASTLVGLCVAFCLGSVVLAYTVGPDTFYTLAALIFIGLVLPGSAIFTCDEGWPRRAMALITAALGLCGFAALGAFMALTTFKIKSGLLALTMVGCGGAFVIGVLFSQLAANFLMMRRVRK